ncbi:aminopeptidase P family protein [Actinomyces naeslundii]|mgnify:FL=1|uniref:aminopeptidase P family protein n=1 Tax=Actinomyces naeslundii TaxID=1655 RepID=UPI00094DC36A|nr:aminopeptidase P family protein [Actinomyces naeslundii]OLO84953.1 Xaa-Pro aminopeptidase [Actinomyces naeslundii]OLO89412.1 Xaa-Pro aminopeptidase [Actinomyces naeslundii]
MTSTSPANNRTSDDASTPSSSQEAPQSLAARGSNRSRQPDNQAFRDFIGSGWGPRPEGLPSRSEAAPWAAARREALGSLFPGERLVLPAGTLKVRNNDCDYRFRPHSAFAHLAGTGTDFEPDAVLVLEPLTAPGRETVTKAAAAQAPDTPTHEAVLYFRPRASRSSQEFYGDPRYGELWVGVRPSLEEVESATGMRCAHIDSLPDALAKDAGPGAVQLRVVAEADEAVTALVTTIRQQVGLEAGQTATEVDAGLAEAASELRLVKDPWEIDQLRAAVAATKAGFDDLIRSIPRARGHWRGERVLEGAFGAKAREEGNGLGYDTIAAAGNHANTLHWINNDGAVEPGQLVLVDAGVEVDSLYTADVTRTIPVDGRFTEAQRRIYQAVLDAADAAFARAGTPGCRFKDVHAAAMEVIAARLEEWGMLPEGMSAADSLAPEGQYHRRWMVHGTSHHLGLDVHDCAQARREMYMDAELRPGMCFTIEPGLYFREDDLLVPEEMRGTGVRIEDDVVVREDGSVERLTQDVPRTVEEVEAWVSGLIA